MVFDSRTWAVERAIKKIKTYPIITVIYSKTCYLEDDNQSVETVLVPTHINYRNSEIGNSDSDFSTGTLFKTGKSKTRHLVFGGNKKRTKFREKNLLGPFLIMVINRFVFVLLLMLFFLFSPDNAVVRNRVSDV